MLDYLRRGATSKIAAIALFLPLIAAFALWGIGPEWRNGGQQSLATIGDAQISPGEFDRAFRTEIEQLSRQAGRQITAEQARQFGIDRRVLARLAGSTALDQQVRSLGLTVSMQSIDDSIRADPNFADLSGKFSKASFDAALRNIGMTETGYRQTRRREDIREQLTDSLLAGIAPAQTYIDLMHKYRGETRIIEHITIDPAKAVKVAEPDDAKLKEFYEANKRLFVTPEQRKAGVLLLSLAAAKAKIEVSADDIKTAYDANKERYDIAETRRIYQMSFANKAAADAAAPALTKAKDFVDAAVKLGAKAADLDLGMLSRAKLIDDKIAAAAFALKKDEVSKVVEGTFATVILKVTDIKAGQKKTLAEVTPLVKDMLQTQRALAEMQTTAGQVEDERSAGKPLAEIAQKLGLEYKEIAQMDSTGKGPDGKPAIDSPDLAPIAAATFSGAVGLDPDPIDLADNNGAAWISILGVTAAKERAFDDVKAEVKTAWTEAAMRRELAAVAGALVERLSKGESAAAIAKDAAGKVETTAAITRNTSPPGLTSGGVQLAFTLPSGGAQSVPTADGKSRTVFRVTAIKPPEPPSKPQADQIKQELTQEMQQDVLNTYVDGLQKQIGVRVNTEVLEQVLSGGRPGR